MRIVICDFAELGHALAIAVIVMLLVAAAHGNEGGIEATIDAEEPIVRAWVIARQDTSIGVESKPRSVQIDGNKLTIDGLAVPGRYDLRFQMASGFVEGWDAAVPESDYVEEQPLAAESKKRILWKMAKMAKRGFADRVVVLDMVGNIQNAAVLVSRLRTRPFVGGGYKQGEWVWRVERWQWEFPEEDTWSPYQERPYYCLVRKRLYQNEFKAMRTTYARHLGGIVLTAEQPRARMAAVKVPSPKPGTHAVNHDGSPTRPITIKPATDTDVDLGN